MKLKRFCKYPGHHIFLICHFAYTFLKLLPIKRTCRALKKKLIVINLIERMGDIVACEPVARDVRTKYPDACIIWTIRSPYAELIKNHPDIDYRLILLCLTEWIWLSKFNFFDVIIDLHVSEKTCGICNVAYKKKTGNHQITTANYFNYGSLLKAFSLSAGHPLADGAPHLYIAEDTIRKVNSLHLPGTFISIHAAADEEERNWDVEKWQNLINKLTSELGISVVEVGHASLLRIPQSRRYINLCGCCSILETAEVIRRASFFIGIESGPAHLANAVCTRGIILLGTYRSFEHYMPYTGFYADKNNAAILHNGPVKALTLQQCLSAVEAALNKVSELSRR